MRVFAAVDLRGGAAVQLVGGDPADERVRLPDPAATTRRWLEAGFRNLHVVDLDAALGEGDNAAAIAGIAGELAGVDPDGVAPLLQVGGGIRDDEAIARVLDLGAHRVVVGTRAVEDRSWLEAAATAHPGQLTVAADVREGVVATRGWRESSGRRGVPFLAGLADLPLAAVLVTDVTREGRQEGVDRRLFAKLVDAAGPHPLIAAGGITTPDDLRALRDAGADGAVLGMALYSGRIDPAVALTLEEQ